MTRIKPALTAIGLISFIFPQLLHAQEHSESFRASCEQLSKLGSMDGQPDHIISSTPEPANNKRPAFCMVRGMIRTSASSTINYRVDLPIKEVWNGKLIGIGGGGTDGVVALDPVDPSVEPYDRWTKMVGYGADNLGSYILVGSDSGHQGRGKYKSFDMSWATNNPDALQNHAYRANHLVLWAAVRLAERYYGRQPEYRYMIGGSNGGRQGIMAAQRYPDDYHGVFAYAPAINMSGLSASWPGLYHHLYKHPDNWLDSKDLSLFLKAEVAACDDLDGVTDGVIGNYEACNFSPASLACEGMKEENCLSEGQVRTIMLATADKPTAEAFAGGWDKYPGFAPGASEFAWRTFLLGSRWEERDAYNFLVFNQTIKYVSDDPNRDIMNGEVGQFGNNLAEFGRVMDTTNPDLSAFFAKGGKIIIWHGASDPIVSYRRTGDYVNLISRKVGRKETRKSLRYFVSPALDHRMVGPEADRMPFLSKLENWVERHQAPDDMIATRLDDSGKVNFTRPVCEFEKYPRYRGKGDSNEAANFECASMKSAELGTQATPAYPVR